MKARLQALSLSALLLSGSALTGCATFGQNHSTPPEEPEQLTQYEADPILIRATRHGDDFETESLDSEEVFQRAFQDFQARRYEDALENYLIIITYFPDSRYHLPALYNGGLCLEHLEEWRNAIVLYERLLEEFPDSSEALNAQFRIANALYELEDFRAVEELLTSVLLRSDLTHFDRIEAHVRRGFALLELEDWTDAQNSFDNALESNRRAPNRERLGEDNRFILQAHYGLGLSYHHRMNQIPLVLPPSRMTEDLNLKADYHQRAQRSYIMALRQHHPYWSVAAGYQIGRLYEDFYLHIFTAEIPDDLTERELQVYFEELRKKIRPLMDRAISVYERNLSLSRRVITRPETEEWIQATALHMSRMRAFLDDPLVQRRAEELVISGASLQDLWDPTFYLNHHIQEALRSARQALPAPEPPPAPATTDDDPQS